MKTSDQINELAAALALAQMEMKPAVKSSENPAFSRGGHKSMYAGLPEVREAALPLAKHGIALVQEVATDEFGVAVTTRLLHKSGQWLEAGPLHIPVSKHDAHGVVSATTYGRRVTWASACGVVADDGSDDDGNAAVAAKPAQVPEPIGFKTWLDDMRGMSETADLDTFRDGYKSSPAKHRKYLEETQPHTLTALVERAKQNAPLPVL